MGVRPEPSVASPAQWALARMLDAAFDDRESADRIVDGALESAGRSTLPEASEELLAFGREHLCPMLAEELGPRLVAALFEDLVAELSQLRRSDTRLASPRTILSNVPPLTVPPITEVPASLPTIQSPAPTDSSALRKVVAVVERDRWTRASVARVLVQCGFDVLPLDTPDDLLNAKVDAVLFVGSAPSGHVAVPRDASSAQIAETVRRVL